MISTIKLAARNLTRYRRRTLLTSLLITLGVTALLIFLAAAGSFKQTMIGSITDSMLGHLQVHQQAAAVGQPVEAAAGHAACSVRKVNGAETAEPAHQAAGRGIRRDAACGVRIA